MDPDWLNARLDENEALRAKRVVKVASSWKKPRVGSGPVAVSVCQGRRGGRSWRGCQDTAGCRNWQREAVDVVNAGGVEGARLAVAPARSRRRGFKRVIFACTDWLRELQSLVAATPPPLNSSTEPPGFLDFVQTSRAPPSKAVLDDPAPLLVSEAQNLGSKRIKTCRLPTE
ncbi:hypothetical protein BKA81DRAFT_380177 [Phyllosticta paracitricarpa]